MNVETAIEKAPVSSRVTKRAVVDNQPTALTNIYEDDVNMAVWQRQLSKKFIDAADNILINKPQLHQSIIVSPHDAYFKVNRVLGNTQSSTILCEDITELVAMFCYLFEVEHVGLRLTVLKRAMCPRFHVDRIPCRLITTYRGVATQWLAQDKINREHLGTHLPDEQSKLFNHISDIQSLYQGDVALMKGEYWEGNEGGGLVHRSPQVPKKYSRLLLTLDFIDD
ncbi:MAG: DUF1826 domain-containing protein [Pseudomonadota bacterium]